MSAQVLLNLLNELGKRDKKQGLLSPTENSRMQGLFKAFE